MLKFIKIILAALLAALSIPAIAAETSLVASDGIRYELAPQIPNGVVQLRDGESRITSGLTCGKLVRVGWFYHQTTCVSAKVVRANSVGVKETGGVVTSNIRLRFELAAAVVSMVLMALAVAVLRVPTKKKGALNGLALALAAFATIAAVPSAFYGFFGLMGAPGFSIDIVLFAVAVGMFATSFFRNERGFRYQALLFEGLMALFIFSVW